MQNEERKLSRETAHFMHTVCAGFGEGSWTCTKEGSGRDTGECFCQIRHHGISSKEKNFRDNRKVLK